MALVLRNQIQLRKHSRNAAFALPTILITSIVMLIVLLVSVSSTTAVRNSMKNQYYAQLAQVAGEAGVAYAQACLNSNPTNPGAPLWTNAKPLMPNTDCLGNVTTNCTATPLATACSVTRNGNIRSNFRIGMPPLDADGHATTLPNTGFVDILRTSNSAVWRTYSQNTAPTTVVPDLCSGSATGAFGWGNAVTYAQAPRAGFPEPSANSISISSAYVSPGPMYLRKDFSVATDGVYTLNVQADDTADVMVDGVRVVTSSGFALNTMTLHLGVGCHTIMVKLTNYGVLVNPAVLVLSLKLVGTSVPIVVSDRTWRVAAGVTRHFSEVNYYADPGSWTAARDLGGATGNAGWTPATGDSATRLLGSSTGNDGSNNYPSYQYTLFRDSRIVTVTAPTQVKIAYGCDDNCKIYLDGSVVTNGISSVGTTTLTLTVGSHQFAVDLYNVTGPSSFIFAAIRTVDNYVLTSTDTTWKSSYLWSATDPAGSYSYDNTYFPVPDPRKVNVLLVAGGGSGGGSTGGGGGGGGVVSTATSLTPGSYSVVVGAGGATPGNQASGISGINSSFNGLVAIGGGGGGFTRFGGPVGGGLNGGSGGGSQDYFAASIAGLGTPLQGNPGGALGYVSASGGGGAGGAGLSTEAVNVGGTGGIGITNSISGTSRYYGGGGGGGSGGAGGLGGGGNSADVGIAGTPNTGGGGGGGWSYASGNGGAGGSGIVIISYPTGSMTATGGTITYSGGNTIHTFTSNGTFVVGVPTPLVSALVVAGGGGGGSGAVSAANGGGGGGGGVVYNNGYPIGVQPYSVTVGSGGAANANGANSVFDSITATGGGSGGGLVALDVGGNGGSGGGGSSATTGAAAGGVASPVGQGYNGGASVGGSPYRGGGGGGAGQVGSGSSPGYGGAGIANSISGVSVFYGGGGGAGADAGAGLGGLGGGGAGVIYTSGTGGIAGTANTGGAGGGGASQGVSIPGGAGGSGIVIISYLTGSITATGGTITTSGSNTIHTFTSSGTFTVTAIH